MAFAGGVGRADGLDRAHHAAVALEQTVGDRDDRAFGCAVREARRMSQAICCSSRGGLSAQAATKAPAVERLMPA